MPDVSQPLSRFRRFVTTDMDEARSEVSRIYCDHRLISTAGSAHLHAWQNAVRLGPVTLSAMSYGAEIEIDPGALKDFYLVMLPYAGSADVRHGREQVVADATQATVLTPDAGTRMRWSADCAKLMVRIEREALERQMSAMLGGGSASRIDFSLAMPLTDGAAHWWRMVRLAMDGLDRLAEAPGPVAASLQGSLLMATLIEQQPNSLTARLARGESPAAPRHVRLVEDYIEENAGKPLTVEDLVAVGGVSSRALFEGFRRFRDTSPLAHLRAVRLRRVREDLLRADAQDTVTLVATRWGFFQLGRFAALYRETFGETPSETLRRR
ncbi:helix-turn-helix domain-containing protein (plasmid) [Aureimonas ureilytica]|uniref:AraC-like ligand-binding domain-containing protein n=1 Tax=Aureimonas ureilytica TaxID=401562 RepID=UPI003CF5DC02